MGITPKCLNQIKHIGTKELLLSIENIGNIKDSFSNVESSSILGIFIFIIGSITAVFTILIKFKVIPQIDLKGQILLQILVTILIIIFLIVSGVGSRKLSDISTKSEIFAQFDCTDSFTNEAFINFYDNFIASKGLITGACVVSSLCILIFIAELLILYLMKDNEDKDALDPDKKNDEIKHEILNDENNK